MNKMSRRESGFLKFGLALSLLVPSVILAERYSDPRTPDMNSLGSIQYGLSGLRPQTNDTSSQIESMIKQIREFAKKSQQEEELYQKVGKGREKLDKLNKAISDGDAFALKTAQDRTDKVKNGENLFNGLNPIQGGISAAAVNTGNLDASCKSGVDFGGFATVANALGSEPVKYLRDKAKEFFAKKSEEAEKKETELLVKLAAKLKKEALGGEEPQDDKDYRINLPELLKKGSLAQDARIKKLNDTWEWQKEAVKDRGAKLVELVFKDLVPFLKKVRENDKEINQVVAFTRDNLQAYARASKDSAIDGLKNLVANCEANVEKAGKLIENTQQWLVAATKGQDPVTPYYDRLDQQKRLESLRCDDFSAKMEDLFGANLDTKINDMTSAKTPADILNKTMGVLTEISSSQAQAPKIIEEAGQQCQLAAKSVKNLKDRRDQAMARVTGGAPGQAGAGFGGAPTAGTSSGSGSTGGGLRGSQYNNSFVHSPRGNTSRRPGTF